MNNSIKPLLLALVAEKLRINPEWRQRFINPEHTVFRILFMLKNHFAYTFPLIFSELSVRLLADTDLNLLNRYFYALNYLQDKLDPKVYDSIFKQETLIDNIITNSVDIHEIPAQLDDILGAFYKRDETGSSSATISQNEVYFPRHFTFENYQIYKPRMWPLPANISTAPSSRPLARSTAPFPEQTHAGRFAGSAHSATTLGSTKPIRRGRGPRTKTAFHEAPVHQTNVSTTATVAADPILNRLYSYFPGEWFTHDSLALNPQTLTLLQKILTILDQKIEQFTWLNEELTQTNALLTQLPSLVPNDMSAALVSIPHEIRAIRARSQQHVDAHPDNAYNDLLEVATEVLQLDIPLNELNLNPLAMKTLHRLANLTLHMNHALLTYHPQITSSYAKMKQCLAACAPAVVDQQIAAEFNQAQVQEKIQQLEQANANLLAQEGQINQAINQLTEEVGPLLTNIRELQKQVSADGSTLSAAIPVPRMPSPPINHAVTFNFGQPSLANSTPISGQVVITPNTNNSIKGL
jgi:hypothetical protein